MKISPKAKDEDLDIDPDSLDDLGMDDIGGFDSQNNFDLGFGGDSTSPMEKHADLLKQLTNFSPFIKDKINGWLGLTWDSEKDKYVRDTDLEPIMNRKCAMRLIQFLKTYTRGNNIITNIGQKDEFKWILEDIYSFVWVGIPANMEEYGINDNVDLKMVCLEVEHAALLVLFGAADGKYNKLLTETTSRHESMTSNPSMYAAQQQMMPGKRRQNPLQKLKNILTGG